MSTLKSTTNVVRQVKDLLGQNPSLVIETVLGSCFWPESLQTRVEYRRLSDDTKGSLSVVFSRDGDGWIEILSHLDLDEMTSAHRFRTYFGGGESERVRNALLILAVAIKDDNRERPQLHRLDRGDK